MSAYSIPDPCHEDWNAMTPRERGRHCAVCDKVVVDLTRVPASEARRLLDEGARRAAQGGPGVCARARVDARRRLVLGAVRRYVLSNGLAAMLAFGALGGAGCTETTGEPRPLMGEATLVEPLPAVPGSVTPPAPQVASQELIGKPPPELQGDVAIEPELTGEVDLGGACLVAPDEEPAPQADPPATIVGRIVMPPQPQPQPQPQPEPGTEP